ncbi:hypothetical protein D9758_003410 [Tetrapyrgos nigripes]|uniref:RING-type domain-containing protein n=1 Tax=Tetrapyrgos nigripes TaxID=182062 RepID=A0A8H5GVD5_9AGAR|nr:hypothetical protein D9758_003410 [Tetrapyrgos nigripes]
MPSQRLADAAHIAPYLTHELTHHGQTTLIPPETAGRMRQVKKKSRTTPIPSKGQNTRQAQADEEVRFSTGPRLIRIPNPSSNPSRTGDRARPRRQGRRDDYDDDIPDYPPPPFSEAISTPPISVSPSTTTLVSSFATTHQRADDSPLPRSSSESDSDESLEVVDRPPEILSGRGRRTSRDFDLTADDDPPTPTTITQAKRRHLSLSPLRIFPHKPVPIQERALSAHAASPYRSSPFFKSTTSLKASSTGSFFRLPTSALSSTSLSRVDQCKARFRRGKERSGVSAEPLESWEVVDDLADGDESPSLLSAIESIASPDSGSSSPTASPVFCFPPIQYDRAGNNTNSTMRRQVPPSTPPEQRYYSPPFPPSPPPPPAAVSATIAAASLPALGTSPIPVHTVATPPPPTSATGPPITSVRTRLDASPHLTSAPSPSPASQHGVGVGLGSGIHTYPHPQPQSPSRGYSGHSPCPADFASLSVDTRLPVATTSMHDHTHNHHHAHIPASVTHVHTPTRMLQMQTVASPHKMVTALGVGVNVGVEDDSERRGSAHTHTHAYTYSDPRTSPFPSTSSSMSSFIRKRQDPPHPNLDRLDVENPGLSVPVMIPLPVGAPASTSASQTRGVQSKPHSDWMRPPRPVSAIPAFYGTGTGNGSSAASTAFNSSSGSASASSVAVAAGGDAAPLIPVSAGLTSIPSRPHQTQMPVQTQIQTHTQTQTQKPIPTRLCMSFTPSTYTDNSINSASSSSSVATAIPLSAASSGTLTPTTPGTGTYISANSSPAACTPTTATTATTPATTNNNTNCSSNTSIRHYPGRPLPNPPTPPSEVGSAMPFSSPDTPSHRNDKPSLSSVHVSAFDAISATVTHNPSSSPSLSSSSLAAKVKSVHNINTHVNHTNQPRSGMMIDSLYGPNEIEATMKPFPDTGSLDIYTPSSSSSTMHDTCPEGLLIDFGDSDTDGEVGSNRSLGSGGAGRGDNGRRSDNDNDWCASPTRIRSHSVEPPSSPSTVPSLVHRSPSLTGAELRGNVSSPSFHKSAQSSVSASPSPSPPYPGPPLHRPTTTSTHTHGHTYPIHYASQRQQKQHIQYPPTLRIPQPVIPVITMPQSISVSASTTSDRSNYYDADASAPSTFLGVGGGGAMEYDYRHGNGYDYTGSQTRDTRDSTTSHTSSGSRDTSPRGQRQAQQTQAQTGYHAGNRYESDSNHALDARLKPSRLYPAPSPALIPTPIPLPTRTSSSSVEEVTGPSSTSISNLNGVSTDSLVPSSSAASAPSSSSTSTSSPSIAVNGTSTGQDDNEQDSSLTRTSRSTSVSPSPSNHSNTYSEFTDLDLLVSRLDDSHQQDGSNYDTLLLLSEFLGPANPSGSSSTHATTTTSSQSVPTTTLSTRSTSSHSSSPHSLPTPILGTVIVQRRRTTRDGRNKIKLSLLDSAVDKCGICLSQFKEGDRGAMSPPCKHSFHERCLRKWLGGGSSGSNRGKRTCPMCRVGLGPFDVDSL